MLTVFVLTHLPEAWDEENWIRTSGNYERICWNKYSFFSKFGFRARPVPSQESELSCICVLRASIFVSFYDFAIGFWNCSDSVVLFKLNKI
jgi:hypothetical protein